MRVGKAAAMTILAAFSHLPLGGGPGIDVATPAFAQSSWKFRFDRQLSGGYDAATGLSVSFSRNTDTIDPTGVFCAATTSDITKARFDGPFRMSPVAVLEHKEEETVSMILASGVDANGTDPLMVYFKIDDGKLWVITDGDTSPVTKNETTLTAKTLNTSVAKNYSNTVLNCLQFSSSPATWLFPATACVFHGAIILAGPILTEASDGSCSGCWTFGTWGFMISQDQGQNWSALWSDDDPQQVNMNRGREWCLKACPAHNRSTETENPLVFWVACTDYVGRGSQGQPTGGRVYVARFKRDDASSDWEIDRDPAVFHTIDLDDGVEDDLGTAGCHTHSAYIVEYGDVTDEDKPVQLIVSVGDEQLNNRLARFIWSGETPDFTDHWTASDDFHARRTTSASAANRGSWGFQPVGVAAGPPATLEDDNVTYHNPSLIWGVDVHSEWINQTILPIPGASPDQLTCKHLWGWDTGFGSARTGFLKFPYSLMSTIHEVNPAILGPLVATIYDTSAPGSGAPGRVLYYPGVDGETPLSAWHQVASIPGGADPTAAFFDGAVWFTRRTIGSSDPQANLAGLYKVAPIPSDDTDFEPIIVSPGGKNIVHGDYELTGGGSEVSFAELSLKTDGGNPVRGVFMDGAKELPPCATMATKAWKITARRADAAAYLAQVYVSSHLGGTSWNTLTDKFVATKRIRRYRAWVLDNSYAAGSASTDPFTPNKTLQMSSRFLNVETVSGTFPNDAGATRYTGADQWCPVTFIAYHDFEAPDPLNIVEALVIKLQAAWSGEAEWPDDNNFYIVVDCALDGVGSLSYPIAHSSTGNAAVEGQPELLTVSKVSGGPAMDGTQDCSLRVSGLLPKGDWNQWAQRIKDDDSTGDDRRFWPLFTLWADNSNYIEFLADCKDRRFRVRTVINGATPVVKNFGTDDQVWLPDSQFYAVISIKRVTSPSLSYKFTFGASLGGGAVANTASDVLTVSAWPEGMAFTQLRFRGRHTATSGTAEIANEVVTMRWIGGEFRTGSGSAYDTSAGLLGAFSDPTLAWMKGP